MNYPKITIRTKDQSQEEKRKQWLKEDLKELLEKAKYTFTYTELVILLAESLGQKFTDIIDKKKLDIDEIENLDI
jgi:hypothetical protein